MAPLSPLSPLSLSSLSPLFQFAVDKEIDQYRILDMDEKDNDGYIAEK